MIAQHPRALFAVLGLAAGLASGCDPGPVELVDLTEAAPAGTGVLDVRVTTAPGSGLGSDAVSGSTVYYARTHSKGFPWDSVTVDASGRARFPDLQAGLYWIAARGADPQAPSGAGEKVVVRAGDSTAVDVPLFAHQAGSLVISEFYSSEPPIWVVVTTGESKYVELYNNSASTILLDGMLIGRFYAPWFDGEIHNHSRCSRTEPYRNDPTALWADVLWQFPGSGSDYPLRPQQAGVIAVSAADHRSSHESFLDLSAAPFEFLSAMGGADNPAAANMIPAGTRPHRSQDFLASKSAGWFVAENFDFAGASRIITPDPRPDVGYRETYLRVPAEVVRDAVLLWPDVRGWYSPGPVLPFCNDPIAPNFDRMPGGFQEKPWLELYTSFQRLPTSGNTLLDTGVSRIDFHVSERTPGWIAR